MANTHKNALIAEMLGDLGKLKDGIDALPLVMKEAIDPAVATLQAKSAALDRAATSYQGVMNQNIKNINEAITMNAETFLVKVIKAQETELSKIVRSAVSNSVERQVEDAIRRSRLEANEWLLYWLIAATMFSFGVSAFFVYLFLHNR